MTGMVSVTQLISRLWKCLANVIFIKKLFQIKWIQSSVCDLRRSSRKTPLRRVFRKCGIITDKALHFWQLSTFRCRDGEPKMALIKTLVPWLVHMRVSSPSNIQNCIWNSITWKCRHFVLSHMWLCKRVRKKLHNNYCRHYQFYMCDMNKAKSEFCLGLCSSTLHNAFLHSSP